MAPHWVRFGSGFMVIRTLATFILSTRRWVPTLRIKSGFDSFVLLGPREVALLKMLSALRQQSMGPVWSALHTSLQRLSASTRPSPPQP